MKRRTARTAGSTVVEVLMAISVLAIGASGVFAMQKSAIVANRNAKNLEIANEISRTWLERLRADSVLWTDRYNSTLSDTRWLHNVTPQGQAAQWFRPTQAAIGITGVHDALGRDDAAASAQGPFCVNLRLSWLRQGEGLMRAEVRVYWLRENLAVSKTNLSVQPPATLCASPPDQQLETHRDVYHMVHAVTAISRNKGL